MTQGLPPKPNCLSIIGGILLAILVLGSFAMLPNIVKWVGAAFTFVPSRLGLIQVVGPADVAPVDFTTSPTVVSFAQPGEYALFTVNYDLLAINDAVLAAKAKPWFKLASGAGDEVEITLLERGMAFYDTPFASGRPVARFAITAPGSYTMTHPRRPDFVYLVPDYTTGHEGALTFYMLAQVGALGAGWWYLRRRAQGRRKIIVPPPPSRLSREKFVSERDESERLAWRSQPAAWTPVASPAESKPDSATDPAARDVLRMVRDNEMTGQQAEAEIEAHMLSQPAGKPTANWALGLGLTSFEAAAYTQGAGITDLVQMRVAGWPTTCTKCGKPLEYERHQWWFVRDVQGAPGLRHIDCPSTKD